MMWPFEELEALRMQRFQEGITAMKVKAANYRPKLKYDEIIIPIQV